jgi:anaerobic selenocysteine-containing dehydrogenase
MTATAQLADIILPETTPFERDGFRGYGGVEGGFVAMRNKVVEPQGEARLALDIEYDIAKRIGVEGDFPWTNTREWMNHRLKYCKTTFEELKEKHIIYTTPPMKYRKYLESGFNTPSRKIELYSPKYEAMGYSPMPEYREADDRYYRKPGMIETFPLVGTTRRSGYYTHTQLRNVPRLRRFEPEPLVRINPADAGERGISDGEMAVVESTQGSIKIKTKVTDETGAGVVIVDFGWGNPSDEGPNVNLLTYSAERDPIAGSTSTHRFRCQVRKLEPLKT